MTKKNVKGMVLGALVGTLMGSISALLLPQQRHLTKKFKNQAQDLLSKAKIIKENVMDMKTWTEPKTNIAKNNFLMGTVVGLLVGAGSALLLAPKSGKLLRKNLSDTYQDVADKTLEIVDSFQLNNHNHRPKRKLQEKKNKARVLSKSKK